jgi:glycosidase
MRSLRRAIILVAILALAPQSLASPTKAPDIPRVGLDQDVIYFVMPDRYRNADPSNDANAGFDPTSIAHFHGGDLKGLTGNCLDDDGLARLKKLGFTAIWLTPLVVQQPPNSGGAGYHGYWGIDFTDIHPSLGTKADLTALRNCATKLGLKLILDVVTNHTGDIVFYQGRNAYIPDKYREIKKPAWLNDLNNYHNFGEINSCWSGGACSRDGDFYGLDDLATEKEVVYRGWADVYGQWIADYGFAGFRVDTARHVDPEFFKRWSPLIQAKAEAAGIQDFTIFGEVWETNPVELMRYVRVNKIQTALDFPFQRVVVDYAAASSDGSILKNLFDYDDYYTGDKSSAQNLVTFLGNHDMGRAAFLVNTAKINPERQLLSRMKLAYSLLYLSRGIPTVYYGDEFGIMGSGNGKDKLARQDLFPTQVAEWKSETRLGSPPVGDGDSFAQLDNPIAKLLTQLAELRETYPALANGQMQIRYAKGSIFAFSKRAIGTQREFLVITNNSAKRLEVTIPTSTAGKWRALIGKAKWQASGSDLRVTIPAFDATVLRAESDVNQLNVKIGKLSSKDDFLSGFYRVTAPVTTKNLATAEFFIQYGSSWRSLGVDLNQPFRIFIDPEQYNGDLQIKAVVTDTKGRSYEYKSAAIKIPAP